MERAISLLLFINQNGKESFSTWEWLKSLTDKQLSGIIDTMLRYDILEGAEKDDMSICLCMLCETELGEAIEQVEEEWLDAFFSLIFCEQLRREGSVLIDGKGLIVDGDSTIITSTENNDKMIDAYETMFYLEEQMNKRAGDE